MVSLFTNYVERDGGFPPTKEGPYEGPSEASGRSGGVNPEESLILFTRKKYRATFNNGGDSNPSVLVVLGLRMPAVP
jgi:hypothetical protein